MHIWRHQRFLLHAVCILSTLLVIALALFLKASYYSKLETARGHQAYQRHAYKEAITHYERAIKWYTPFSRSVRHSVERLWDIGTTAERQQDFPLALNAYRALRASLFAIQSFDYPYRKWIPKTEGKIASLMSATAPFNNRQINPNSPERDRARFAAMLKRETAPKQGGVLLAEFGFLGWIGATIGFIWYALGNNQMWIWQRCLLWGSTVVIFFTAWIVGMLIA